jgi:hypothetical protein
VIARVPVVVIGDPDTENIEGTVQATEETYTVGATHRVEVPLDCSLVPLDPTAVRPVPPDVIGIAAPEYEIARVPDEVIGPDTENPRGTVAATEVTVPEVIVEKMVVRSLSIDVR